MTLSEKIAAGLATDAEVARALGCKQSSYGKWIFPDGKCKGHLVPPRFTTCLTTLAKECERRGLKWVVALGFGRDDAWIITVGRKGERWDQCAAPTPALALCAALVAAVERKNDDR
jgi:hypothetical protein